MSKATDPGKLKDSTLWEDWSISFTNLLSVIPATSDIPLSYVIREAAEPVHGLACHPLEEVRFIADRKCP
jgi:hypothetical protein